MNCDSCNIYSTGMAIFWGLAALVLNVVVFGLLGAILIVIFG
jgi:hypothetical protein